VPDERALLEAFGYLVRTDLDPDVLTSWCTSSEVTGPGCAGVGVGYLLARAASIGLCLHAYQAAFDCIGIAGHHLASLLGRGPLPRSEKSLNKRHMYLATVGRQSKHETLMVW